MREMDKSRVWKVLKITRKLIAAVDRHNSLPFGSVGDMFPLWLGSEGLEHNNNYYFAGSALHS